MSFNLVLGISHNILWLLSSRSRLSNDSLRIQDIPTACLHSRQLCVSNHVHDRTRAIRFSTPGSHPGRACPLEYGSHAKFRYGLRLATKSKVDRSCRDSARILFCAYTRRSTLRSVKKNIRISFQETTLKKTNA